jgi:hypothetical protein
MLFSALPTRFAGINTVDALTVAVEGQQKIDRGVYSKAVYARFCL